jgi:ABC-type phosphate/phosphonate transport system permease subunit
VVFTQSIQNFQTLGKTLSEEELQLFKDFVAHPLNFCFQFIWLDLFLGAILGLILSFFIKKKTTSSQKEEIAEV